MSDILKPLIGIAAKGLADGLMTKADAQKRHIGGGGSAG